MKKLIAILTFISFLTACNRNDEVTPDEDITQDLFVEGEIDVEVTMPGNPLIDLMAEVYTNLDTTRSVDEQMEELTENLTDEEKAQLIEFSKTFEQYNSGLQGLGYMLSMFNLPILGSKIYLKDNEVTAKYQTVTYFGENTMNANASSGQHYVQSRFNPENSISFIYTDEDLNGDGGVQNGIDANSFTIEKTNETANIGGFISSKSIYTPINQDNGIFKLEVWTSELMPTVVNFMHPYYMEETGGIMKISIYMLPDNAYPIIYEFKQVTSREVEASEMTIKETNQIYNLGNDAIEVGFKLLGIMFPPSSDDDDDEWE